MCLTAKKQTILDVWVGLFSTKKEKWQFPVLGTFDFETVFCPVVLMVRGRRVRSARGWFSM